jgi:hypothetical protein
MNEDKDSKEIILGPADIWLPGGQQNEQVNSESGTLNLPAKKECTCGIESIGGGIHSEWCDKYEVL